MSDVVMIGDDLWTLGQLIGSGGFGEVRMAESSGRLGAMKLVPKDPGARRELLFADNLRGVAKVMPILGTGETADTWAILMPLAETTLRQYLSDRGGVLEETDALPIIAGLCEALVGISNAGVIHRDLKPENILLHGNEWCLCDFGISRYIDATTFTDTMRYSMTKPYAAPEQWRDEDATSLTDVYALGVVAYELLQGSRPFSGPNFRHQHLHQQPSPMTGISPSLAALIEECLFKEAGARPSALNLFTRLQSRSARNDDSAGFTKLQEANRKATAQASADQQRQSKLRSEQERRTALFDAAHRQLTQIGRELREALMEAAPRISEKQPARENWQLTLGDALIQFSQALPNNVESQTGRSGRDGRSGLDSALLPFDVIAYATISVSGLQSHNERVGRAHSLWFCDAKEPGTYRWYETAFHHEPTVGGAKGYSSSARSTQVEYFPDSATPFDTVAHEALRGIGSNSTLAWPFTHLQPGQLNDFVGRWAGWLAECAEGTFQPPIHEPKSHQKTPPTPSTDRVPGTPANWPPSCATRQTGMLQPKSGVRNKRTIDSRVVGAIALVIVALVCIGSCVTYQDPHSEANKAQVPQSPNRSSARALDTWKIKCLTWHVGTTNDQSNESPCVDGLIRTRKTPIAVNYVIDGMGSQDYQRYDPSGTRLNFELFDDGGGALNIEGWPPTDNAGHFVLYLTRTSTVKVTLNRNSDGGPLWTGLYKTTIAPN